MLVISDDLIKDVKPVKILKSSRHLKPLGHFSKPIITQNFSKIVERLTILNFINFI